MLKVAHAPQQMAAHARANDIISHCPAILLTSLPVIPAPHELNVRIQAHFTCKAGLGSGSRTLIGPIQDRGQTWSLHECVCTTLNKLVPQPGSVCAAIILTGTDMLPLPRSRSRSCASGVNASGGSCGAFLAATQRQSSFVHSILKTNTRFWPHTRLFLAVTGLEGSAAARRGRQPCPVPPLRLRRRSAPLQEYPGKDAFEIVVNILAAAANRPLLKTTKQNHEIKQAKGQRFLLWCCPLRSTKTTREFQCAFLSTLR